MKRPNWIPYTPSAVNILLDKYKEYADHLEAEVKRLEAILAELAFRELTHLIRVLAKKALEDSDGS